MAKQETISINLRIIEEKTILYLQEDMFCKMIVFQPAKIFYEQYKEISNGFHRKMTIIYKTRIQKCSKKVGIAI